MSVTSVAQGGTPAVRPKKKNRIFHKMWNYRYLYLLLLPGLASTILFAYVPMYGLQIAFKNYSYKLGIWGSPWNNFAHFKALTTNAEFIRVFWNTIEISLGRLVTGFPAPIILALLLNELSSQKFKKTIQSILYLPNFVNWVVMYGIIYGLFSQQVGVVNKIFASLGMEKVDVLTNPSAFRPMLYISAIWKSAGWGTIIYMAAIAGVDPSMYESAFIDGANRFQQVFYITIPSLAYSITILLILDIGGMMNAGFDQIFTLKTPQTAEVEEIIDTYVYRMGILSAKYDFTTAVGLFKNVINCVLLFTANYIVKLLGQESFI